jgi:hypothetical protein
MYETLVARFKREEKLKDLNISAHLLDAALVRMIDKLYYAGHAFTKGEKTWAAVRFFLPNYSRHGHLILPRSARALKGWRKLTPQKTRRPLPWEMAASIAGLLAQKNAGMALAWALGLLLRTPQLPLLPSQLPGHEDLQDLLQRELSVSR